MRTWVLKLKNHAICCKVEYLTCFSDRYVQQHNDFDIVFFDISTFVARKIVVYQKKLD